MGVVAPAMSSIYCIQQTTKFPTKLNHNVIKLITPGNLHILTLTRLLTKCGGIMKTDKQLLERFCCEQDPELFREFYYRYEALLRERAFRFLKNREDTEDFLQEFWLRLLTQTKQIRTNEKEAATGYLIVMVNHDLYDYLRIKELNTENLDDYLLNKLDKIDGFAYDLVEDEVYRNEIIANQEQIVNKLPKKDRLIYQLHTSNHLSVQEISRICSLSEKTVRNRLAAIKNNIKGQLQVIYAGSCVLPLFILAQSNLI